MVFPNRGGQRFHNQYPVRQPFFNRGINYQSESNLSTLTKQGAGGLSKTLGNIQQVLHLVQTAAPVIEEYGPMIKNLPSLYKMMKIMNEAEEGKEDPKDKIHQKEKRDLSNKKMEKNRKYEPSKPKLFI